MPFVAKRRSTGERLDLTQIDPYQIERRDVMCQLCGADMVLKRGMTKRPHFSHLPKQMCSTDYRFHPESREHLLGKQAVADLLRQSFDHPPKILLEFAIAARKRVADIMCVWPTGWQQAHEIQLAAITPRELEERTNDYLAQGIDVRWWLGKRADTPINRAWCDRECGEVGLIEFEDVCGGRSRVDDEDLAIRFY